MSSAPLDETESKVLRAVHTRNGADLYDLAQAIGTGPRTVQKIVHRLVREDLVHVSERGVRVHCTRAGDEWVRAHR